jgi:hypothetical protein
MFLFEAACLNVEIVLRKNSVDQRRDRKAVDPQYFGLIMTGNEIIKTE